MIAVGATSLGFGTKPLPRVFELLREWGGECVELNSQPGLHDGLILGPRTLPQVSRWTRDTGVEIRSVAGYNDFAQADAEVLASEVARLRTACEIAHELGVGTVRAFTGEPKEGLAPADARASVARGFADAAEDARDLGVTLAIENHGRLINDGRALASLVEEVGSPRVRLTLDTGNFFWAGRNLDQGRDDFAAVLPYAVSVHVKDGVWTGGGFEFVPAGDGALPLAELLRELRTREYDGPVYSEYEGAGEHATGTRSSIAYLRAQLHDPT